MKAGEYILKNLKELGVNHAFGITGGSIAPLFDCFEKEKNLEYICTTQEQGAAMAAEAYSRINKKLGVAMSTSGPGGTNLITGIGCAFFDSIPTLYITGQVNDYESTWKGGPRQVGFQEINIVDMVKPITKYAARVDDINKIRYEFEKALYFAKEGRPGPVLLDLPFNTQKAEVDWDNLARYSPEKKFVNYDLLEKKVDQTLESLYNSERPVLILGAGVKIANAEKKVRDLIERLGVPVTPSWGGMDILPHNHPYFSEGFGVSHNRTGNFAVQNSDLIISLGSRLDTRQTGAKRNTFGRGAKKIILDVDAGELYKGRGMEIDIDINYDLNDFLDVILEKDIKKKDFSNWIGKIQEWRSRFPIVQPEYFKPFDKVNPYVFIDELSSQSKEGDIIIPDAGGNLTYTMQAWKVKEGQKLFSAFGNSPMGYSVCAGIGASFASDKGPITCIIGDGGFKMNINELETVARHNLPLKIFIMNNHEYGIIKQFQDSLFGSRYKATCYEGGLGNANLLDVSKAYGLNVAQINSFEDMNKTIKDVLECNEPIVCSVELNPGEKVIPKVEFGRPIEDSVPLLDREEFNKIMIVPPLENKK